MPLWITFVHGRKSIFFNSRITSKFMDQCQFSRRVVPLWFSVTSHSNSEGEPVRKWWTDWCQLMEEVAMNEGGFDVRKKISFAPFEPLCLWNFRQSSRVDQIRSKSRHPRRIPKFNEKLPFHPGKWFATLLKLTRSPNANERTLWPFRAREVDFPSEEPWTRELWWYRLADIDGSLQFSSRWPPLL